MVQVFLFVLVKVGKMKNLLKKSETFFCFMIFPLADTELQLFSFFVVSTNHKLTPYFLVFYYTVHKSPQAYVSNLTCDRTGILVNYPSTYF